jgi:hypothetical protein
MKNTRAVYCRVRMDLRERERKGEVHDVEAGGRERQEDRN